MYLSDWYRYLDSTVQRPLSEASLYFYEIVWHERRLLHVQVRTEPFSAVFGDTVLAKRCTDDLCSRVVKRNPLALLCESEPR